MALGSLSLCLSVSPSLFLPASISPCNQGCLSLCLSVSLSLCLPVAVGQTEALGSWEQERERGSARERRIERETERDQERKLQLSRGSKHEKDRERERLGNYRQLGRSAWQLGAASTFLSEFVANLARFSSLHALSTQPALVSA